MRGRVWRAIEEIVKTKDSGVRPSRGGKAFRRRLGLLAPALGYIEALTYAYPQNKPPFGGHSC